MSFECQREAEGFYRLTGELTIYAVDKLRAFWTEAFANLPITVMIDLSGITRMDSAGIQFLVSLKTELNRQNKKLNLSGHSDAVLGIYELYGLLAFFGDPVKLDKKQQKQFRFPYGRKKGHY